MKALSTRPDACRPFGALPQRLTFGCMAMQCHRMELRRGRGRLAKAQRTAVVEAAPPVDFREGALWSIAMLRIAVELKRPGAPGLEEIVDEVVGRMGISKVDFEKYLAEHLGLLKKAVDDRGCAR